MSDDRARDAAAPTVPLSPAELAAAVGGLVTIPSGTELAGRYRIERFLARGGMGAVYEATDRELGVTVALKTVRPDTVWGASAVERFKREIQLARAVTHPGVCRIFDLGRHGELVFLTMELLRGATLAELIHERGRLTVAEATAIVTEIAGALGAAHTAGVVHRDLKPSNVMLVERRGRRTAVITDFGLARDVGADSGISGGAGASDPARAPAVTGVAGTPDYMAPEQLTGGVVGAPTDLYALGVVMYEMVTGELPAPAPVKLDSLDPRWAAAIRRCLAPDPRDRFASSSALVEAIAVKRRRWRDPAVAAVVAVAVGAAAVVAWPRQDRSATDECAGARPLAGVWDEARRSEMAQVFVRSAHPDAAAAHARIQAAIDRHAARWLELDRALCHDRASRRAPAAELTARGRCLTARLSAVRALTQQLTGSLDAETAAVAVRVAESLEPPDACSDGPALLAAGMPATVDDALDARLAEVQVLIDLARYAAAVPAAEAAERAAAGDERRHAAASFLLARARIELGDLVAAEAPLREAIRLAARVGDDATLARCWVSLVRLLSQLGRLTESATIAEVAEAAVVRAGSDPRLSLTLQYHLGDTEAWDNHYVRSLSRFEAAVSAAEASLGPHDPDLLIAQLKYAEILIEVNRADEGLALADRARRGASDAFGEQDFRVALAGYVRGMALRDLGRFDEARAPLERAVEVTLSLGADYPGRHHAYSELGRLFLVSGDLVRAKQTLAIALAGARALPGPDELRISGALGNLADAYLALGELDQAEATWREALALRRRVRGERSDSVGRARSSLGAILLARGDRAAARTELEAAVELLEPGEVPAYTALARARLGRLLWSSASDRPRAVRLAAQARPDLRAPSGEKPFDLVELARWIATACGAGACAP